MRVHHRAKPKYADLPRLEGFVEYSISRKGRLAKLRVPKATSPNTICGHGISFWISKRTVMSWMARTASFQLGLNGISSRLKMMHRGRHLPE